MAPRHLFLIAETCIADSCIAVAHCHRCKVLLGKPPPALAQSACKQLAENKVAMNLTIARRAHGPGRHEHSPDFDCDGAGAGSFQVSYSSLTRCRIQASRTTFPDQLGQWLTRCRKPVSISALGRTRRQSSGPLPTAGGGGLQTWLVRSGRTRAFRQGFSFYRPSREQWARGGTCILPVSPAMPQSRPAIPRRCLPPFR